MYKNKYLKYKNKYINLRNQLGGDVYFNVYTTGLSNWQSTEGDQNILKKWNSGIRENIVKLIPEKFGINFIHYDPFITYDETGNEVKIIGDDRETEIKRITGMLSSDFTNKRVKSSIFIDDYLDLENLRSPYIILDIAHIFVYPNTINIVQKMKETPSGFEGDGENLLINSVRFGFIGDKGSFNLAKSKLFEVLDDGSVITYIDKMIEINNMAVTGGEGKGEDERIYKFNPINPADIIYEIKNKVLKYIYDITRNEQFIKSLNITESIINYIWNNMTPKQIVDKLGGFLIKKFYEEN